MRRLAELAVLLASTAASAEPLATVTEDIDGNGTQETLAIDATGTLTIGTTKVALGGPIAQARIASDGRGAILVVTDRHGVIVKGGREIVRFPVGGVGLDADYATTAAVTSLGIVRYQTRHGIRRCDGKPALVFAEGFDGSKFRRLANLPVDVDANAPRVAGKPDTAAPTPVLYQARVASHQIGAGDAGGLAIPAELDDGKPTTVWREELTGFGKGQWFTYETRTRGAKAKLVRVQAGGKAFNRPKTLVVVGEQAAVRIDLPDTQEPISAELPTAVEGCVTVILEDTYGGAKGQTAIAELSIYAEGERAGGGDALLAKAVADGSDGAVAAGQALARRGASGAAAIEAELGKAANNLVRRRLVAVLVNIDDAAAVPSLVRAATEGWAEGDALVAVVRALVRRGTHAELARIAGNRDVAVAARVAAATGLAGSDPQQRALLGELAGTGPHAVRKAVIDRLALASVADLVAAATAASTPAAAGDVWRAVTKRARASDAERTAAVTAQLAALATATDYDRRYRLLDGIAEHGDAAALRTLDQALRALPASSIGAALKQAALGGAAAAPRGDALGMVTTLATDRDPGVRLAALTALAGSERDASTPWHAASPDGIDRILGAALATDAWPDVRRRAASALGLRCQRSGPRTSLVDAVTKDTDALVRGDSLIALVQCRAQGVAALLAAVWDDGKAPIPLRTQAVGLAVALGDPALGATLVDKFTRWRSAAIESEAALALAQTAAAAIARLRAPGAAAALEASLGDEAFPEIISAAATALGTMGPACPASAKAKLKGIAASGTEAARAAEIAAAGCGAAAR